MFPVLVASLLATIPVWIPTFPPMTDLPQHAAQVALLRSLLHPGFQYEPYFYINWFTPYLFGYALVYPLLPLVGVVAAFKIVISLALVALPLTTALVLKEAGADRRLALLVIPAMYGISYQWGFLNFLVATPVCLAFLALAFRQATRPTATGAVALGVMINVLFFCHALICAFAGLVAGIMLLSSSRTLGTAVRRLLPLATVVPVAMFWTTRVPVSTGSRVPVMWDLNWWRTQDPYYSAWAQWATPGGFGWGRVTGLFPRILGARPGVLPICVGVALLLLPFAAGARFTRRLINWIPLVVCSTMLLLLPGALLDTVFVAERYGVFVLPLFLITLRQPEGRTWPRWTWAACALIVAGWIGVVAINAREYEADAGGFEEILAHMAPGERALSVVFDRDSRGTIAPPFLHFPSWYSALKSGLVDPSGAAGWAFMPVQYRPEWLPPLRTLGFEWTPGLFDWKASGGAHYRYFIVRAPRDLGPEMFRQATCRIHLAYQVNHWWLFEKDPGCASP
jgi:hypothetical protein